jgi:alkanesulfonate monooxygenase SsuD/methylene tetrahydromethanopterin reductase-like flavin-dependent oxidoreductase (luciferase family)
MENRNDYNLGIMFRREHAPEKLPDFARWAEVAGFDELWIVEDCFYSSGIASATTALACTDSITVGVGIMPAVVRNPVIAAMEIATLARLYPGRFLPGFGHGVAGWMRQIGAFPRSQLKALEEVTVTHLEHTKLVHPPDQIPPISLGVVGPKSLVLSGRVADGTILSEYSNPAYVSWAREQIISGNLEGDHNFEHRLTVFAFAGTASTTAAGRNKLRPMVAEALASSGIDPKLAAMGILPQVREYRKGGGQEYLEAKIPDAWIDQLTIAGTPEDWRLAIDQFVEIGTHSIILVPLPDVGLDEMDMFARHILSKDGEEKR